MCPHDRPKREVGEAVQLPALPVLCSLSKQPDHKLWNVYVHFCLPPNMHRRWLQEPKKVPIKLGKITAIYSRSFSRGVFIMRSISRCNISIWLLYYLPADTQAVVKSIGTLFIPYYKNCKTTAEVTAITKLHQGTMKGTGCNRSFKVCVAKWR